MNDFGELLIVLLPRPLASIYGCTSSIKIYGMPIHRLSDRIKGSA
jgi:hypothetical protein